MKNAIKIDKKLNFSRWPQLDFDLKNSVENNHQAVPRPKKKKLFNVDNEAIVDLTS